MTEAEKLKERIRALGYDVVEQHAPNTYHRTPPLHLNEIVVCNGRNAQRWDKKNDGHPCTTVSYLHWHDGIPITFIRQRTLKKVKETKDDKQVEVVKEVEGSLDGFEECIAWYCKPPTNNGKSTRTDDKTTVDSGSLLPVE
jgi:hypothetical protein